MTTNAELSSLPDASHYFLALDIHILVLNQIYSKSVLTHVTNRKLCKWRCVTSKLGYKRHHLWFLGLFILGKANFHVLRTLKQSYGEAYGQRNWGLPLKASTMCTSFSLSQTFRWTQHGQRLITTSWESELIKSSSKFLERERNSNDYCSLSH